MIMSCSVVLTTIQRLTTSQRYKDKLPHRVPRIKWDYDYGCALKHRDT